jgi:hypothetical protein
MSGPTPPCEQFARVVQRVLSVTAAHLFGDICNRNRGSSLALGQEGNSNPLRCVVSGVRTY